MFAGGVAASLPFVDRDAVQPISFPHKAHTKAADCTLCHHGVRDQAIAGLPSPALCSGCHARAPGTNPSKAEQAKWDKFITLPSPWVRYAELPSHVFFSHRRHVTMGALDCATCHGDMEHRTAPPSRALKPLPKMRDCIGCHKKESVSVDCTACHR